MPATNRESLAAVLAVTLLRLQFKRTNLNIRKYHEALWWIVITAKSTRKLVRRLLRLSKRKFDSKSRARIRCQTAESLSCLRTRCKESTLLEDEVLVFIIPTKTFTYRGKTEATDQEFIKNLSAYSSLLFWSSARR